MRTPRTCVAARTAGKGVPGHSTGRVHRGRREGRGRPGAFERTSCGRRRRPASSRFPATRPSRPPPRPVCPRRSRSWQAWTTLAAAAVVYVALGFVLWIHAWVDGATTHTLCGCGDPALFLWFFQWPATALAHGENPFYSTALFHPGGFNMLSQTSVMGLSVPLVPVTWIWGPVASFNVASTLTPALTAFSAFVVLRRWAPWTPAAFVGGLFYGFSPFVLTSLPYAHLMTAALMLLPPILAVLDEILIRQRHSAVWSGVVLGVLVFAQFFLSSEILAIAAVLFVIVLVVLAVAGVLFADPAELQAPCSPRRQGARRGPGGRRRAAGLARLVRARRPGAPLGARLGGHPASWWLRPGEFRRSRSEPQQPIRRGRVATGDIPWARPRTWAGRCSRCSSSASSCSVAIGACASSASCWRCAPSCLLVLGPGSGCPSRSSTACPYSRTSLSSGTWPWASSPRPRCSPSSCRGCTTSRRTGAARSARSASAWWRSSRSRCCTDRGCPTPCNR